MDQQSQPQTDFDELLSRIATRIVLPIIHANDAGDILPEAGRALHAAVHEAAKRELAAVHFGCSDLDKS